MMRHHFPDLRGPVTAYGDDDYVLELAKRDGCKWALQEALRRRDGRLTIVSSARGIYIATAHKDDSGLLAIMPDDPLDLPLLLAKVVGQVGADTVRIARREGGN